jgi:serine/threonine-protein phosphatase with EF-hand domain
MASVLQALCRSRLASRSLLPAIRRPLSTRDAPSSLFRASAYVDNKTESESAKLAFVLNDIRGNSKSLYSNSSFSDPSALGVDGAADIDITRTRPDADMPTFHLPARLSSLTVRDGLDMLAFFTTPPYNHTLHPFYFCELLREAGRSLRLQPAVNRIEGKGIEGKGIKGKGVKVHVVGDLHGSLPDLDHILQTFGPPSVGNVYVFNGDFVDRGVHSLEVLSTLMALHLAVPSGVFLNRGNHEDSSISEVYGFRDECLEKMKTKAVWAEVKQFFSKLPYAVLVPKELAGGAFVTHGGVRKGTTLETFDAFPRDHESVMKGDADDADVAARDVLWSDPDLEVEGERENESRGCGMYFGVDVVRDFVERVGVGALVRSHQSVYNGISRVVVGKQHQTEQCLYTVFSATDYPNFTGCNQGGVLTFAESGVEEYRYETEEYDTQGEGFEFANASFAATLMDEIRLHKPVLGVRLREIGDGRRVSVEQWCDVLREVIGLDIDWKAAQPELATRVKRIHGGGMVETDDIDVEHFLAHLEERAEGKEELEKIFQRKRSLFLLFKFLDKDGSGGLDINEFKKGIRALNERMAEEDRVDLVKVEELFEVLDTDGNGTIDLHEFGNILSFGGASGAASGEREDK